MSGPAPYAPRGGTLLCPACLLYNSADSGWCDQCGAQLQQHNAGYQPVKGDVVRCSRCPAGNQRDAVFCRACGGRLSPSAYPAAMAAQQAATSSSGRDPVGGGMAWSSQQREEYLTAKRTGQERAARLAVPERSGDVFADLGAAVDHLAEVESLWLALDEQARQLRIDLGSWPDPQQVAVVQRAEAEASMVWQARQAAVAHRDRLQDQVDGNDSSWRTLQHPGDGWSER